MNDEIRVLGISGSLRSDGHNAALLRAAAELLPVGMALETYSIAALPRFDVEVEHEGVPDQVRDFIDHIAQADALLIATPEYNAGISGVLKDAIDWASRPPLRVLQEKPVALIGASTTAFGTIRAQMHLRSILQSNNAFVLPKPDVLVPHAQERFTDGRLTHEPTREQLRLLLVALGRWTRLTRNER